MMLPHLDLETEYWNQDRLVLGIDEVGRGAFAGPMVFGGTVFDKCGDEKQVRKLLRLGINDSKKLTRKSREKLYKKIKRISLFTTTVFIDVDVINKIGLGKATMLGMQNVVLNCFETFQKEKLFVLTDAFKIKDFPELGEQQLNIIRGDSISVSIAAASIIAKVERDSYMRNLSSDYPGYGFGKHVGYGTKYHRDAILKHGVLPLHRKIFLRKLLAQAA